MDFYTKTVSETAFELNTDVNVGLDFDAVEKNAKKYGQNVILKKTKQSLLKKIFSSLKEPMLLILLFGFAITFGASLGEFLKNGKGDFVESFGILFAVILSVTITLVMEGSSEKAFNELSKIYDNVYVKVVRNGEVTVVLQSKIVVGDLVFVESGDKIVADGRLVYSNSLTIDESALTGESVATEKNSDAVYEKAVPLAERKNCVYSGTFVSSGNGRYIVTAIGNRTEIGNIANTLTDKTEVDSPLQQKLAKLGKRITLIGVICAVAVFITSFVRLVLTQSVNFYSIQELFISCIVLIVAAVPEGLPTIVAVSLALNMFKLAKENALIKKMIATETAGAVSVICSDKTGTLTKNKMSVISVCTNEFCVSPEKVSATPLIQNFICNSTAEIIKKKDGYIRQGNGTECALIESALKTDKKLDYKAYRLKYAVVDRKPFSSQAKMMETVIINDGIARKLIKGAPEKVLPQCNLTSGQVKKLYGDMEKHQRKSRRILCFAHKDDNNEATVYDGYAVLTDAIRKEVYKAVKDCKTAGIKIKILTGDNYLTAYSVAEELGVVKSENEVINAHELEALDDENFKKALLKISVIARSTPIIKLRVVKALKNMGEVVAVTGDGINDAPAIKHADIGIAMGKIGSEITKEAADVVLLDDSFATIIKAVSFGRNVYKNLQRFILFQLSVNFSAMLFITVSAFLGLEQPFNTLQLLWINVIMDGPPALTLGLEATNEQLMKQKPVSRDKSIVSIKMLCRIAFNGLFIGGVVLLQYVKNFLGVSETEKDGTVFTLFVMFQLMNAFNSREMGAESIFKSIRKNKIMLITFAATFLMQIIIVQFFYSLFGIAPLSFSVWIKCLCVAISVVVVSEIFKLIYKFAYSGGIKSVFCRKQKSNVIKKRAA